jgi:hypothetical protein
VSLLWFFDKELNFLYNNRDMLVVFWQMCENSCDLISMLKDYVNLRETVFILSVF